MARGGTVVKMPTRKELREAAEALGESNDEYLDCRDLRHPWSSVGAFYKDGEIRRKLVCERCGTEAVDRWTSKGERIARTYRYAEGYQVKGVRIRPLDVRKEVLKRVTVFKTEDDLMASLLTKGRKRA